MGSGSWSSIRDSAMSGTSRDSVSSLRTSTMKSRKRAQSESPAVQARRIAQKATERFNVRTGNVRAGSKGLWNLREAINLHYKRHFILLLMAVGYSVCYSMVVVAEIGDELKDLRSRVSVNPSSLNCGSVPGG